MLDNGKIKGTVSRYCACSKTLIFGQDVPNSKRRENRDRDLKILLHPPQLSSISG